MLACTLGQSHERHADRVGTLAAPQCSGARAALPHGVNLMGLPCVCADMRRAGRTLQDRIKSSLWLLTCSAA